MKKLMKYNIAKPFNKRLVTGKSFTMKLLQSLLIAVSLSSVYADDTEILFSQSNVNNNVLFVMDLSGSMTAPVAGTQINNGEDYVLPHIINDIKDDLEEIKITDRNGTILSKYYELRAAGVPSAFRQALDWYNVLSATVNSSNDLEMGQIVEADTVGTANEKTWPKRVVVRFTGINIPPGTEIKEAYIQFTSSNNPDSTSSDVANFEVQVQDSNNSNVIDTRWSQSIERLSWAGSVAWNPPAWDAVNESGDAQKTTNLKDLVQYIVNKSGWLSGRAMAFKIEGTGSRTAQAFDFNASEGAAVLTIIYAPEEGEKTRLQVMQDALKTVLVDAPTNLSVGLMHYGDSYGLRINYPTGVDFPVKPLEDLVKPIIEESVKVDGVPDWYYNRLPVPNEMITVRQYLSDIASSWTARGNTPIVDSLYEASLYFRGERSLYGDFIAPSRWAAHPATYTSPAPDLVELPTQEFQTSLCTGRPVASNVYGDSAIARLRNGTINARCPADITNPTGPGSAANCAATEFGCTSSTNCVNWVYPVTHKECTGVDESGNPTGCQTVIDTPGYCLNNNYVTYNSCRFWRCNDEKLKNNIPTYKSPVIADCQSNNVILMSDGKPETRRYSGAELYPYGIYSIKSYMGNASCEDQPFGFKSGSCGAELTRYLADNDINPDIDGIQTINTYVIGFSEGITENAENYLKSLVTMEDDPETEKKEGYFSAQNEADLATAFKDTLDEIAEEARSNASPGYSVNVNSGLEHEDELYIPVFDKSNGSVWSGNLKKFKLIEENGNRFIRGKVTKAGDPNSTGYINAMTELGVFEDTAWDEWSESDFPDGNNVEKGGAANLMTDPSIRNLYSNITGDSNVNLSAAANHIKTSSAISMGDLGLTDSILASLDISGDEATTYKNKLINFIRGWVRGIPTEGAETGLARKHMGDMLHSQPLVLTYQKGGDDGVGKEQYVFAATNEGYLHAFDASTGEEVFAFMPKELLKNVQKQFTGEGKHAYGIDGILSYWHNDTNHNGEVDGSEHVWLYFGLRRGGTSYYALDVTDITAPELKWVVKGGDTGFEHLNQSWSAPYIANVSVNGSNTPAIIFTGGNDPEMDYGEGSDYTPEEVKVDKTTNIANGVYIVDANDGSKLWDIMNAGVSNVADKLTHAIPGGARILDVDRNGLLDRLYFADTGGDVWRLDLKEDLSSGSTLTKLASLGGSGTDQSRKFYNEPDVAMMQSNGQTIFSVSIGSGIRPHPMNEEIEDHMFVLLDRQAYRSIADDSNYPYPIEISDLEEVTISTGKVIGKSAGFEGKKITDVDGKEGWYVNFGQTGEKVLASSITFEGSIIFTTLIPITQREEGVIDDGFCSTPETQGRLYAMDLLTGEASMNLDNDDAEEITDNDVFVTISSQEIPSAPERVFNRLECENGSCTHDVDIRVGKKSTEAGTTNVERLESVYWNSPETF